LPGLQDSEGCEARIENRLEVAPRNKRHLAYLPLELRLKTLRWKKIDCHETKEGVRADTEETRVYLIRRDGSLNKLSGGGVVRVKEWLEQRQKVRGSSGDVERFEGELLIGKTYRAHLVFDERVGWRLSERIKTLPHHAAGIEWVDKKRLLSSLIKENRYSVEFKVVGKSVRRAGNSNRWNTTYKCALREALILIPPSATEPTLRQTDF
jgi:hypothetical protein